MLPRFPLRSFDLSTSCSNTISNCVRKVKYYARAFLLFRTIVFSQCHGFSDYSCTVYKDTDEAPQRWGPRGSRAHRRSVRQGRRAPSGELSCSAPRARVRRRAGTFMFHVLGWSSRGHLTCAWSSEQRESNPAREQLCSTRYLVFQGRRGFLSTGT